MSPGISALRAQGRGILSLILGACATERVVSRSLRFLFGDVSGRVAATNQKIGNMPHIQIAVTHSCGWQGDLAEFEKHK